MSEGLWWIPIVAGLTDGLNPCVFASAAVLIYIITAQTSKKYIWCVVYSATIVLALSLYYSSLDFLNIYLEHFLWIGKLCDGLLGLFFLRLSWESFNQWRCWHEHKPISLLTGQQRVAQALHHKIYSIGYIFLAAIIMAMFSTQWPADINFIMIANNAILPGRTSEVLILVFMYCSIVYWPLWLMLLFFNSKKIEARIKPLIISGIMLAASTLILLIFK